MKKVFLLVLLLLLAACGGEETAVENPITAPAEAEETVAEPVVEDSVVEEEVQPIAAKPQLVEFYADW